MWPFAHLGFSLLLARAAQLPLLPAALGALAPDALDKTLYLLGWMPGTRSIGHALLFGLLLAVVTYAITRQPKPALAFGGAAMAHLALDAAAPLTPFYPFDLTLYSTYAIRLPSDPLTWVFELYGLLVVLYLLHQHHRRRPHAA